MAERWCDYCDCCHDPGEECRPDRPTRPDSPPYRCEGCGGPWPDSGYGWDADECPSCLRRRRRARAALLDLPGAMESLREVHRRLGLFTLAPVGHGVADEMGLARRHVRLALERLAVALYAEPGAWDEPPWWPPEPAPAGDDSPV